jgi:hypothetical protein
MGFDPKDMLAAQRAKILWCVHVLGPDDMHAMPSYDVAAKNVNELITALFTERTATLDVLCLPVVAVWPYSSEAHREDLKRRAWAPAAPVSRPAPCPGCKAVYPADCRCEAGQDLHTKGSAK